MEKLLCREGAELFFAFQYHPDYNYCIHWAEACLADNLGEEVDAALLELAPWMGASAEGFSYSEFEVAMRRLSMALGVELPDAELAGQLWLLHEIRHGEAEGFPWVLAYPVFSCGGVYAELYSAYTLWEAATYSPDKASEPYHETLLKELDRLRRELAVQVRDGHLVLVRVRKLFPRACPPTEFLPEGTGWRLYEPVHRH